MVREWEGEVGRWWEGGRMHKYTEGKVKYFDNWKSGKRKRRCHKIYFLRHQEWRCGMATPVSHPFSARPEGWRSTSAVAGMPFRCGGTVPSVWRKRLFWGAEEPVWHDGRGSSAWLRLDCRDAWQCKWLIDRPLCKLQNTRLFAAEGASFRLCGVLAELTLHKYALPWRLWIFIHPACGG